MASAMSPSAKATCTRRSRGSNAAWKVCRVWDLPLLLSVSSSVLGYAYVLAGRPSEALPLLEQYVSTEAMQIMRGRVHVWLSEAYLRLGRLDEARAGHVSDVVSASCDVRPPHHACFHGEVNAIERMRASARCCRRSLVDRPRRLSGGHTRSQSVRGGRSRPSVCGVSLARGALQADTQTA